MDKDKISEAEKAEIRQTIKAMSDAQKEVALESIPDQMLIRELTYRYEYLQDFYIRITSDVCPSN